MDWEFASTEQLLPYIVPQLNICSRQKPSAGEALSVVIENLVIELDGKLNSMQVIIGQDGLL